MNVDAQSTVQEKSLWWRVGLLTITLLGPIVNTVVERMRQRSQSLQNSAQTAQTTARQRLDELAQTSR
jgi:heme exporter protein D